MNKRQLFVSILVIAVAMLSRCAGKKPAGRDARGEQFAAASTCMSCHKDIYESYITTAHYHTSAPASPSTVKGSFDPPHNVFHFANATDVIMERKDSLLFQTAYVDGKPQQQYPFDITIGSGRKAQTYLYWQDKQYFQLPISYFVPVQKWANSPGFPASHPNFSRVIPSTCFGCHSSMVASTEKITGVQRTEEFEKKEAIFGIDCQRCHGPAAEHVNYHTEHPAEKAARFITKINTLANQQQLDMCALCHSGLKPMLRSAFLFKPGDVLADFLLPTVAFPSKPSQLDVHGNQYQLLTASKCFTQSKQMNCSTCHDPHTTERNNMQVFSRRCMSCHQADSGHFCKLKTLPASTLQQNCIDCHMPALPSGSITLLTNGQESPIPDSVRTHLITIYPDATKKILMRMTTGSF
ncbi:multiheme c-type cytochrome [Chitinophaga cymbidii]|uniref:Cytochrome c n=1 Tax=Chitinophaga cymbidii TaxID=1096750 RepID=A0A512RNE6_9BACT|nr:multiheme c-type cytochrome [Chitinophaga cymbidii]GEP97213.1 cytochrome c [Chitinophaga cymbidii]